MKKLILALILTVLSVQFSFAQEVFSGWRKVDENAYINPDTIVGVEDFHGFTFLLKSFNKGQYEPIFGKDVYYTIANYTINCAEQTYKIGVIDSYGHDDSFVNGDYNRLAEFQPIVEGTAVGNVSTMFCKGL